MILIDYSLMWRHFNDLDLLIDFGAVHFVSTPHLLFDPSLESGYRITPEKILFG